MTTLSNPGFLQIYGNISLLNIVKIPTFIETLPTIKSHLILCADNLNFRKGIQNKFVNLTQGIEASF